MLKKTITYTDFNDEQHTEDFYFNLSKSELTTWELQENLAGGLGDRLRAIIESGDGRQIMAMFKEIIRRSYGKRSADGKSFVKNEALSDEFLGSGAYDELFMQIITSPDEASVFIQNIVPQNLEQVGQDLKARMQHARRPQDHLKKAEKELPTVDAQLDPREAYRTESIAEARQTFDQTPKGISDEYLAQLVNSDGAMELANDPFTRVTQMRLPSGERFVLNEAQVEFLRSAAGYGNESALTRPPHESGAQG